MKKSPGMETDFNEEAVRNGSSAEADAAIRKIAEEGGRTDLLLRFFDSSFFNEWIALT